MLQRRAYIIVLQEQVGTGQCIWTVALEPMFIDRS